VDARILVRVTAEALDPAEALAFVADRAAGATCAFVGTVRDRSDAGEVTGILYEVWEDLAPPRLTGIAGEVLERFGARKVAILHRFGELTVGDVSVVVAASAGHRAEAFEACRHGIERVKEDAPIWKKEALVSGESRWVRGS
jgi:molybdopterin synthase catalytic subunit